MVGLPVKEEAGLSLWYVGLEESDKLLGRAT